MVSYKLVYQKVDVALDFKNFNLKGSTNLKLKKVKDKDGDNNEKAEKYMIPVKLPMIGNPVYRRVMVNDLEVDPVLLKSVNNYVNPQILEDSIKNVDLMTYEGLHLSVQSLKDSMMYVEVNPDETEVSVDITFDYYDMTAMNSEIYFEKHWILPRGSTNYKEYKLFVSSKDSECWFPTFCNPNFSCHKYEFNVTVPTEYNVICGFPLREDFNDRHVNQHITTKTYRFTSFNTEEHDKKDLSNNEVENVNQGQDKEVYDNSQMYENFGIFVGEFDFRDGLKVEKKEERTEEAESDEELVQMSNETYELNINSKLTYVTLKGMGYLLNPTNIATTMCLETYKEIIELELSGLYLLFLPYGTFQENMDMSSCIRTQNYVDFKRCSGFTSPENYLFSSFMDQMTQMYNDLYYKSGGNMLVYSMEVLHSFADLTLEPKCVEKRIGLATGLSSLYLRKVENPSRDLHLNLMLQSYLVDQFIKRNMGNSEHKLRLWARRELFATLVELVGDNYPLTTYTTESTKDKEEGSMSEQILMNDTVFLLKCQLIPTVLESIFINTSFLTESYIVHLFKRHLNHRELKSNEINQSNNSKTKEVENKEKEDYNIWDWLVKEVVGRYVTFWNNKPQNRLNKEKQLDKNMSPEDILKKGVEHDQLNVCITNLMNLIKSFVYGTGCPQISMGLILQLQRKGTSMDHLSFRIDVNSLQPPLDVNEEGKTKYTLMEITSQSSKNLYNIYNRLLELTHYTQQTSQKENIEQEKEEDLVYKILLNIYGIIATEQKEEIIDFGDIRDNIGLMSFSEIGLLRKKMCLFQTFFDSVDMIGRDGNFVMGFGYIGNHPWTFCLGYGPLWDCVEMLKNSIDVNKIIDLLIDNGTNYCGTFIKSDYKLQHNLGQLPVGTSGGIPYWKLILIQKSLIQNSQSNEDKSMLCLSGGYAKKWMFYLVSDIVEDDGVRESVRLLGDLVPINYNVNPRAKRGRKKVALKGIAEDLENDIQNTTGNFTSNTGNNNYLGIYSECDKALIEWMKQLYMSLHPELTQLDNRSIVAKICSKTRLPLLWIRVDSMFSLLGRIRRCQSGSMWEQQLNSDNNIYSLIEASQALGSFGKSEYISDNPLIESACKRLDNMIKKHKSHPIIRARCMYSLVCLYNRDPRQHKYLYGVFTKYLSSFTNLSMHPTESRFIMEFYKGLCLLRNEFGFSPEFVLEILANTIENTTGPNMLIQASNIMESASYLSIPNVNYQSNLQNQMNRRNVLINLWDLLWHMFRLDGIPGSCSNGRVLTAKFLLCLSRQPVFMKLCVQKFKNEKDYGFEFDPLLFIPLKQHAKHKLQSAFELSQTYNSKLVKKSAVRLSLQVLLEGSYVFKWELKDELEENNNELNVTGTNNNNHSNSDKELNGHNVKNKKESYLKEEDDFYKLLLKEKVEDNKVVGKLERVEEGKQIELLKSGEGVLEAVKCACFLFYVLRENSLKVEMWELFYRVLFDTCLSKPVVFADMSKETLERSRNYMLVILKKASVSKLPFYLNLFPKVHKTYALLFGYGTQLLKDPKPDQKFINKRIERLTSGLSMPKIASFRRAYGEGESGSGVDWKNVALEAVRALKELPQAHWFLKDPEKSFRGYKTVIKTPIWLNKIEQKAVNRTYTIPMQFKVDMALLFKNAKMFNKVDTIPYKDAVLLEEQFESMWPCIVKAFQKSAKLNTQPTQS